MSVLVSFLTQLKFHDKAALSRITTLITDKVVSNPLPAARQNSQRPARGGWRMRGNRGAINRPGQPRMPRGGGRGFLHQRHPPYMPNRFQQVGLYIFIFIFSKIYNFHSFFDYFYI